MINLGLHNIIVFIVRKYIYRSHYINKSMQ